jgi:hypothetical protein
MIWSFGYQSIIDKQPWNLINEVHVTLTVWKSNPHIYELENWGKNLSKKERKLGEIVFFSQVSCM